MSLDTPNPVAEVPSVSRDQAAVRAAPSSNEGSQSSWSRKFDAAHLTLALVLLYAVGFVVVNFRGGPTLIGKELQSFRYLTAAILLVLVIGTPALAGYGVATVIDRLRPDHQHTWRAPAAMAVGMGIGYCALYAVTNIAFLQWDWFATWMISMEGFLVGFGIGGLAMLARPDSASPTERLATVLGGGVIALALLVLLPLTFGRLVYPLVSPQFGGGAPWLATIHRASADTLNPIGRALREPSLLLDRDDKTVVLLVCLPAASNSSLPHLTTVALPTGEVTMLELHTPIIIEQYAEVIRREGCKGAKPIADLSTNAGLFRRRRLRF